MLELRLDEASGIYAAPLQMKANNGIFLIDDFGRQLISPRDLLNRWIVPLDRRVDYLSLQYGVKFQIPFEVMVVFATNLDPNDLADATTSVSIALRAMGSTGRATAWGGTTSPVEASFGGLRRSSGRCECA